MDARYEEFLGGKAEKSSGRMRSESLWAQHDKSFLVFNGRSFKQFGENGHVVGERKLETYMSLTNRSDNSKRFRLCGFGPCCECSLHVAETPIRWWRC